MTARTTMADLITVVRTLVNDPSGGSAVFSDDAVQAALDNCRTDVFQWPLSGQAEMTTGGVSVYKLHASGLPHWESGEVIQGVNWATLTPTSADRIRGTWTFSAGQDPTIYATGSVYDVFGAACVLLDQWMAKLKFTVYDFSADGGSYKRSQMLETLREMRSQYAKRSTTGVVTAQNYTGDL